MTTEDGVANPSRVHARVKLRNLAARQARELRRRRRLRSPRAARPAGCGRTSRRAAPARRRCASRVVLCAAHANFSVATAHAPTLSFSFVGTASSLANGWVPSWHTWSGAPAAGGIMSGSTCLARLPGPDGFQEPWPGRARGRARAELRIRAFPAGWRCPSTCSIRWYTSLGLAICPGYKGKAHVHPRSP